MDKLYVLMYSDIAISDFRIFSNFDDALIEYLKSSIFETKNLLLEDDEDEINPKCLIEEIDDNDEECDEEEDSDEDNDSEDDVTCTLQIYNISSDTSEFKAVKEFDVDYFQDLISEKENLGDYLDDLEEKINDNNIPSEIKNAFQL